MRILLHCAALLSAAIRGPAHSPDTARSVRVVPASGPLAGKQVYAGSHALIIGINEYLRLNRNLWLNYAVKDATDLCDVLVGSYGFPPENITLLPNAEATKRAIEKALAAFADRRRVHSEDRILIFFSGHGQTVKLPTGGEMGFLMPCDAEVDAQDPENPAPFLETCVRMDTVWSYLESSPAKHALILADACYSGLLATQRSASEKIGAEALASLAARRAMQVMTAGRKGEVSLEMPRLGHGAFTFKLLEEMRARAAVPGDVFTAQELFAALQRSVANVTQGKQTPQFAAHNTEGEFLFITAGGGAPDPQPQPASAPSAVSTGADDAEMVYVPEGEFTMGSDDGDSDEKPVHRVYVPAFTIDKYEVTNEQYVRFLNSMESARDSRGREYLLVDSDLQIEQVGGRWRPKAGEERHPVVNVTWYGAMAYAKWAGKRLPTEAEWEKAARSADGRKYPWGNVWDTSKCQSGEDRHGYYRTAPVGSFLTGASPYGCLDMAGNVWEWTSSLYKAYPYRADDGREDERGTGLCVLRGGSWYFYQTSARAAARFWYNPGVRFSFSLGFRCARSSP